jgi:hypothetical protein
LAELGIRLETSGGLTFFATPEAGLEVAARDGAYRALVGGELYHRGGLTLRWAGGSQRLTGVRIVPGQAPETFAVLDSDGTALFYLDYVHPHLNPQTGELLFRYMDLRLSSALAQRLGHPHYAGLALGAATIATTVSGPDLGAARHLGSEVPTCEGRRPNYLVNFNADPTDDLAVDIALATIGDVGCTRCSNPRVNLVPAVTLRNVGAADLPWFWRLTGPQSVNDPLGGPRDDFARYGGFIDQGGFIPDYAVQHPYLVWAVYRIADGEITMLGQSQLKHAFSAVNSDCPCPESQILWAENCTDRYGLNTNTDIQHLGPRGELTAHRGAWQHELSHFDPDGDLLFNLDAAPAGDEGAFYEQLSLTAAQLQPPGDYYVEAWYIAAGDRQLYNSVGYRQIAPSFDGTIWTFPVVGGQRSGPLLNAWVDPLQPGPGEQHSVLCSSPERGFTACSGSTEGAGHLQLAVKTTALGAGRYRYRYALLNLDYDARIRELQIPLADDVTLSELRFGDIDASAENDWQPARAEHTLRWSAPVAAAALDWGTLYTFSFIADSPPAAVTASLVSQETTARLVAATLAPAADGSRVFSNGFEGL